MTCERMAPEALQRRIRAWLVLFMAGLVVSGLTAFPLLWELELLVAGCDAFRGSVPAGLDAWIRHVHAGLAATYRDWPFVAYGTDWLAFAHLSLAVFFIGPLRDPVRNLWVLHAGLIACVGVISLALICGPLRGIPLYWRLLDCSFGIFGGIPLWRALRLTRALEKRFASPQMPRR